MIGNSFSQVGAFVRNRIALLNVDGSADATLNPNANDTVRALAVQADGRLVVGGFFTTLAGQTRNFIARLSTAHAAVQSLTPVGYSSGGSLVTWMRSGAGPELALRRFQFADQPHLLPARAAKSALVFTSDRLARSKAHASSISTATTAFSSAASARRKSFFRRDSIRSHRHARWSQQPCPSVPIDRNGVTRNSHYPIKRLPCHVMLARLH